MADLFSKIAGSYAKPSPNEMEFLLLRHALILQKQVLVNLKSAQRFP